MYTLRGGRLNDFAFIKIFCKRKKEKKESTFISGRADGHSKSRGGIKDGCVVAPVCWLWVRAVFMPAAFGCPDDPAIFAAFFILFFYNKYIRLS